jgi:ATP-binding cassette subfamily B protein
MLKTFIWRYVKPNLGWFILSFCATVIGGTWSTINAILVKNFLNALETNDVVFWIPILLVANLFIHESSWRIVAYVNYKIQLAIQNKVIVDTFDYVHKHSHQFFQANLSGRIAKQIFTLADSFTELVHDNTFEIVRGTTVLIISLMAMSQVHPYFLMGLACYLVIFSAISLTYSKRFMHLSALQADKESETSGQLVDSLSNAPNVRLFARLNYEKKYVQTYLKNVEIAFQNKEWFGLILHATLGFSMICLLAFTVSILVYLKSRNLISIGEVSLVVALNFEVAWTLWHTLVQIDKANKSIGKLEQALKFLFVPQTVVDDLNAKEISITKGEIVFENVSFHYKGVTPLFNDKSITIAPGEKIGLVGYSGGGKSTFVNLILRLYDLTSGRILIDGQDIALVTQESLHASIALIPQDPSLFHRSLMENIRYGRIDASDEEVIEAAKKAHAHDFIVKSSKGYDSEVGERGVKLSGGQRQRVAIARAILKDAPILILDEATSQLDSVTENLIQEILQHLMQNRTSIVIAHRLSTLLHMDRILVFNNGIIVQDGTHESLLAEGGLYKTLWDAQVGGFLSDDKREKRNIG